MLLLLIVGARAQVPTIVPPGGQLSLDYHKSVHPATEPLVIFIASPAYALDKVHCSGPGACKGVPYMHASWLTLSIRDHRLARYVSRVQRGAASSVTAGLRPTALAGSAPGPAKFYGSAPWGSPLSAPQVSIHLCTQAATL